ncbi:MAG TPA: DUF222 domain-containing protein [Jiangellales bacterium]|nr:DUF222 domain-containing protein [Jiangellales bacterium]
MFDAAPADELAGLVDRLAELPAAVGEDPARIDVISQLEKLKAAAAGAQPAVIAEFAASQEAANKALGVRARQSRRGVPEQVGLARKVSPASAARQVSQARALIEQLPETFGLLRRGQISEHVATIVATETSHLAAPERRQVDTRLAEALPGLSPRRAEATARRAAIEADPLAAVERAGKAREDRRVGIRPAPDTMAIVTALLPCEQGVATYAALHRQADALIATGDGRSRGQIMADTLVERVTGQATAEAVSAEIGLIMTDTALFSGDDAPAQIDGYGPIPAELARHIARGAPDRSGHTGLGLTGGIGAELDRRLHSRSPDESGAATEPQARVFLRRLFTDPVTGVVTDVDPRRRRFDGVLAKLLVYRDQRCRDPYCDAPVRHLDHIQTYAGGGPTTATNGRGVCERGNYVRHMPGWSVQLIDTTTHLIEITTPTGHKYESRPPPAPGYFRSVATRARPASSRATGTRNGEHDT